MRRLLAAKHALRKPNRSRQGRAFCSRVYNLVVSPNNVPCRAVSGYALNSPNINDLCRKTSLIVCRTLCGLTCDFGQRLKLLVCTPIDGFFYARSLQSTQPHPLLHWCSVMARRLTNARPSRFVVAVQFSDSLFNRELCRRGTGRVAVALVAAHVLAVYLDLLEHAHIPWVRAGSCRARRPTPQVMERRCVLCVDARRSGADAILIFGPAARGGPRTPQARRGHESHFLDAAVVQIFQFAIWQLSWPPVPVAPCRRARTQL